MKATAGRTKNPARKAQTRSSTGMLRWKAVVVAAGQLEVGGHGEDGRADRGPGRHVPRAVEHLMRAGVVGGPLLEERVTAHDQEEREGQDHPGDEDVPHDGVTGEVGLPRWHQAQRSLEETDVPVGLGRVGGDGRVVRAEQPDRVDLGDRAGDGEDTEHEKEQGRGLGHEDRVERLPDLVPLPLLLPGPLGVALMPHDH
jgi:hypothetical protein